VSERTCHEWRGTFTQPNYKDGQPRDLHLTAHSQSGPADVSRETPCAPQAPRSSPGYVGSDHGAPVTLHRTWRHLATSAVLPPSAHCHTYQPLNVTPNDTGASESPTDRAPGGGARFAAVSQSPPSTTDSLRVRARPLLRVGEIHLPHMNRGQNQSMARSLTHGDA